MLPGDRKTFSHGLEHIYSSLLFGLVKRYIKHIILVYNTMSYNFRDMKRWSTIYPALSTML